MTPTLFREYTTTVLMRCRTSFHGLFVVALAAGLIATTSAADSSEAPAAETRATGRRPESEVGRAARRQSRVIEMYDPGFRHGGPTRRDRGVERSTLRGIPGMSTEDDGGSAATFVPQTRAAPVEPERSLWLDILYDRDQEEATAPPPSDDPFEQLWGGSPDALPASPSFSDPYEQMLQSYRELMEAEEQKVEQQLMGGRQPYDPFDTLREFDDSFMNRSGDAGNPEPALANLLQEATRGLTPDMLDQLQSDDLRALAQEPFSPTIRGFDEIDDPDAQAWSPDRWRTLFNGGSLDDSADLVQTVEASEGWGDLPPFRPAAVSAEDHDFAGLGSLRRQLMQVDISEASSTSQAFAPTLVGAGAEWRPEMAEMLDRGSTFDAAQWDGMSDPSAGRQFPSDWRRESATTGGFRDLEPTSLDFDRRGGMQDRMGGTQIASDGFGEEAASSSTPSTDRRSIFNPRESTDPFLRQSRFGDDDWGGLGR